jgi:putative CocE/NonD family hydrolase
MTTTATTTSTAKRPSPGGRALDQAATRLFHLPPASTDYTVARGVRVPMRDGVELSADLYRPTATAVGTVLVRGPYGRSLLQAMPMARIFAARGYNALFVSSRGTFGSGGAFSPMVSEVDDGHDVVAWMRDQSWYTGTFATVGGSYLGFTQWALLVDPPADMVTAVISIAPHDFREHAWGTGAFRLDFLGWSYMVAHQEDGGTVRGMLLQASAERRNAKAMDELPLARAAETHLDGRAPWYVDWVTRPDASDPHWQPMQLGVALERADLPILLISGWQDLFLDQTLEQYRRLHERGLDVAMTIGPWSHVAVGAGAAQIVVGETFDWMEEHLAKRAGRARASAVHVCVTGIDEWRDLPDWPPPTSPHTLYLHPHLDLSAERPPDDGPASSFVFDPAHPTPTVGGPLLGFRCVKDDTELGTRSDVATFTTPVLNRDLEVLGPPVLELVHESDNPHVDLFARISEIGTDGRSHNVTEGFVRLDPDRGPGPVSVTLRSMAHRFVAGTRLRLVVAGGSHPQFARNLGTGDNPGNGVELRPARHTIHHGQGGGSRLVLPVAAT